MPKKDGGRLANAVYPHFFWQFYFRTTLSANLKKKFPLHCSIFLLIVGLRHTKWGRNLYAVGGKRLSADRLSISERAYWVGVYVISGFTSAATGAMLLGWSGGGFIGVGDQYLFLTSGKKKYLNLHSQEVNT